MFEAGKPGDFSDLTDTELEAKIKAYEAIDKSRAPVTIHRSEVLARLPHPPSALTDPIWSA